MPFLIMPLITHAVTEIFIASFNTFFFLPFGLPRSPPAQAAPPEGEDIAFKFAAA